MEKATKRYGAIQALRGVSFSVPSSSVVALCGHNGAGKSTLVKALVGLVKLDDGEIRIDGSGVQLRDPQDAQAHGVALVDQELSVVPALSVADNLFLGNIRQPLLTRRRRRDAARSGAAGARRARAPVRWTARVESLRMGERQLLEIARLLGRNSRVLILDEPTASLSDAETQRVFGAIRNAVSQGKRHLHLAPARRGARHLRQVVVLRDGEMVADGRQPASTAPADRHMMLGVEGREVEGDRARARQHARRSRSGV